MKKLAFLTAFLVLSMVSADGVVDLSYTDRVSAEPYETVEIALELKNVSGTVLKNCTASVDIGLVEHIEYFTIVSEPSWDEISDDETVNGKIAIKISSNVGNLSFDLPIIISGDEGTCSGGCTPFYPEGPFYVSITVRNEALQFFNQAETLYGKQRYEEAMEKYDKAKKQYLEYFDKKNAQICLGKINNCRAYLKLDAGISYYDSEELEKARAEFEEARLLFESIEMKGECDEWIAKCETPETEPPSTTPVTTAAPTTTPPTSVQTTSKAPSSAPDTSEGTSPIVPILLVAAILVVIGATIKIIKK
ncbi:MAG: tetratricopeptide repeat protein [Euryarchaeota archaeon]|nr:tetratricopeptide repeat protein [Euryarchaeota archaeon]